MFLRKENMFNNLRETIKNINADVRDVANCEKAKKLRKRLLAIGLTLAVVGYIGVFVFFFCFAFAKGEMAKIITYLVLFMVCGVIGSIGTQLAALGFKIVVTGYTSNLINETVGNNCPNCGQTIEPEVQFCSRCGAKVKKECPNCHHINNLKNDYCEKCGNRLN